MTPRTHRTTVAGVTIDLPIFKDPQTTEEIAQRVTQRIREIEETSTRIDTQAFALRAAADFAMEVAAEKEQRDADAAAMVKALSEILARLDELLNAYGDPDPPRLR